MFRKLKIRLTLINLILVSVVLLIVFSGIYTLMKSIIDYQTNMTMMNVARRERVLPPNFGMPGPNAQEGRRIISNSFYVKTDFYGNAIEMSPNIPITIAEAKSLVKNTIGKSKDSGSVTYKNLSLKYLIRSKTYGYIIVYLDRNPDMDVLSWLVIISIIIGGISLILVFTISLYLANKALVPIKNAWEKQRAFVADASHELRTPLAVLSTSLEIVLDNPGETIESQANWLENIQSEVNRMSKLVEELLFLARSDSENDAALKSDFNISYSLSQVYELFKPFAAEKGIELTADIEDDVLLNGNEGHIKQLATILIDNAIKYTPDKGSVRLLLQKYSNDIVIEVIDTGIGIPPEHHDKIFERFFKLDKARTKNDNGSGLGLSIADCIAKEHNGNISVTSNTPTGSIFKVTLGAANTNLHTKN